MGKMLTRKRKFEEAKEEYDIISPPKKRNKGEYEVDRDWIAASRTRNFFINDPIIDYLEHTKGRKSITNQFTRFLLERGLDFEQAVMDLLTHRFGAAKIQKIAETKEDIRDPQKARETEEAMKSGVPIIYQGVLHNWVNKTYGCPDLLVRSDYVNKIVESKVLTPVEQRMTAVNLSVNAQYHYRIIDIKFSTLHLRSDGVHLLNSGSFPAYKSQLHIYNYALGLLQGYLPPCAYILGRKWDFTRKGAKRSGNSCFEKLGSINYLTVDQVYVTRTEEALEWLRDLRRNGHEWKTMPPSCEQLYPNMSNKNDNPWGKEKRKIAEEIKELTMLWQCGPKNRDKAHAKGVYGWDDKRLTPEMLGIKNEKRQKTLQSILDVNRDPTRKIIPSKIPSNVDWMVKPRLELFIDFETVNDLLSDLSQLPYTLDRSMIFMIGCGWEEAGEWRYKSFCVKRLTSHCEYELIDEFMDFIDELVWRICPDNPSFEPRLIHWAPAEPRSYERAYEKHYPNTWELDNWFDLCEVFKTTPIAIKDCFDYSLKSVVRAMKKHKMIETSYEDSSVGDGMSAMMIAHEADKEADITGKSLMDIPDIQDVMKYNEIDVKVMWEMLRYLRNLA